MTYPEITDAIWASMPVPSVVYDNHERIVEINPAAESFFNVSRRSMVGSFLWHRLILEEHLRENFSYALGNAARLFVNEVKVSTYQGTTCLCNLKLAPMSGENELMLLMIVPRELAGRMTQTQTAQSASKSAIGMAEMLAHEIKNPLGGIKGAAQLLSKEADASIYQDYLEVIITETDRLTGLVDNLVGPNIKQVNESINIHRLLEQCRSLLSAQAGGKIDFQRDYDPSLPETIGSAQQLYQAILNITKNALEAVTESDTSLPWVRFSTRAIRRALPGSKGAHTMLRVRIEDNGPGIPEDLKERIFFPMVSGRAQGSGLGLSITQTIISRHRGWIEVESEPGHTAIDVMLPLGDMP